MLNFDIYKSLNFYISTQILKSKIYCIDIGHFNLSYFIGIESVLLATLQSLKKNIIKLKSLFSYILIFVIQQSNFA